MGFLVKTPDELAESVARELKKPAPFSDSQARFKRLIWAAIDAAQIRSMDKRKSYFRAIQSNLTKRSAESRSTARRPTKRLRSESLERSPRENDC